MLRVLSHPTWTLVLVHMAMILREVLAYSTSVCMQKGAYVRISPHHCPKTQIKWCPAEQQDQGGMVSDTLHFWLTSMGARGHRHPGHASDKSIPC